MLTISSARRTLHWKKTVAVKGCLENLVKNVLEENKLLSETEDANLKQNMWASVLIIRVNIRTKS